MTPASPPPAFASPERVARACVCCGDTQLARSPAILMPFIAHRVFDWEPVVITEQWGLRTIQPGFAYPLCNSLYCRACDFLFLDLRFSDAEMARLYADYRGTAYTALRERYEPGYEARNAQLADGVTYLPEVESFLRPHIPPHPTVLDWGGDTGKNTPFRHDRQALDILEISEKPTIAGAKRITIREARRAQYDLIVCTQVLEHVPDPVGLLREIRECMTEATVLYLELPHEELMRRAGDESVVSWKRHWHEHINFFSGKALAQALTNAGLSPVVLCTSPVQVAGQPAEHFRVIARRAPSTAID